MEISLAAEKIFNIGNIEITNSIISAFIVVFFIVLGVILIGRKLNIANPGKLQIVLEMLAEGLISQISDVRNSGAGICTSCPGRRKYSNRGGCRSSRTVRSRFT